MQKLTKAWNKAPAGTPITTSLAEKRKTKGAVLVDEARMAHLTKHGFFRARKGAAEDEPVKKITKKKSPPPAPPASADDPDKMTPDEEAFLHPRRTLDKLAAEGKNVVDRRLDVFLEREPSSPGLPDAGPASPRPDSGPKGDR